MVKPSKVNPWMQELSTTITKGRKFKSVSAHGQQVIDVATGELTGIDAVQVTREVVDKDTFVKIFAGGISAMFDLNKAAQDLFKAVLKIYAAQTNQPLQIYINEASLEEVGYTRAKATRIRAINELINSEFIAEVKGMPNMFWTNPNIFYKGNRMTAIKQYAIKGTAEGDAMQHQIDEQAANANQGNLL
jgi:hypothetical protein